MKSNDEMEAADYAQIKKLYLSLTIDDVKDDISTLLDLIKKHHPHGVSFLEDLEADYSDRDNPKYMYKFPAAIAEFQNILSLKYQDKIMQSAVFVKVINEVVFNGIYGNEPF